MPRALTLALCLTLAGCIAPLPNAVLRNPQSGQMVDCTLATAVYSGYRPGNAGLAAGVGDTFESAFRERQCINSYLSLGYECLQGACR